MWGDSGSSGRSQGARRGRPAVGLLTIVAVAIAGIAFFGSVATSWAWNEPDGFMGVPWGSSEMVVKEKLGLTCADHSEPYFTGRACRGSLWIGPVPVTAVLKLHKGRLVSVSLLFLPNQYIDMLLTFAASYGRPTSTTEGDVADGARWEGEKVIMDMLRSKTESAPDFAMATITTREEINRQHQESREYFRKHPEKAQELLELFRKYGVK